MSVYVRISMEKQAQICEDLFWHSNFWQNYHGQSSKVCGHVVSYWRHHGASHWVLNNKCRGNRLLCLKNHLEHFFKEQEKISGKWLNWFLNIESCNLNLNINFLLNVLCVKCYFNYIWLHHNKQVRLTLGWLCTVQSVQPLIRKKNRNSGDRRNF